MVEITNVLKNKFTQDLCIYDSIHDFWKERGNTHDDDDLVDNVSLEKTRAILLKLFSSYTNAPVSNINQFLQLMTNHNVSSATSNYENSVKTYYETQPIMSTTTEYLTYDDIINGRSGWDGIVGGVSNAVCIELGKKYNSFAAIMADKKQNVVAEFILKYMFPNQNTNVYLTFDAKTGIMRSLFREIEQVFHLITPANIADSASTSFNRLRNGRNVFQFPGQSIHTFHSNLFSSNTEMKFENKGFNDKNNYGFALSIKPASGGSEMVFPFSAKQSSGPSVNYLVDLLLNKPTNSKTMLNLENLKKQKSLIDNGILFDLKRSGDYEQVNAAKVISKELGNIIVSTIDILCSVYARTIHQPVIRHLGEKLYLYRFSNLGPVDKETADLIQLKFKVLKLIQNLGLIKNTINNQLVNELHDFYISIHTFLKYGKFLLPPNLKEMKTSVVTQTVPEKIVELLLKHRLFDVLSSFQILKSEITTLKSNVSTNADEIEADIDILTRLIDVYGDKINKPELKQYIQTYNVNAIVKKYEIETAVGKKSINFNLVEKINKFIQTLVSVFTLSNSQSKILGQGGSALGLNVFITERINSDVYLTGLTEISSIKFAPKKYLELCDSLFKLERVLSRPRHPSFQSILTDADYYGQLSAIYESYSNKSMGQTIFNIMTPVKTSDEAIQSWFNALITKLQAKMPSNRAINELDLYKVSAATKRKIESIAEPVKRTRRGGSENMYQYIDLNDLLADICSQSASYIESAMTQFMHSNSIKSMLQTGRSKTRRTESRTRTKTRSKTRKSIQSNNVSRFIDYLINEHSNEIADLMEHLAIHFENGLVSMHNEVSDLYTYNPSETELYLLCILNMNRNNSDLMLPIEQTADIFGNIDTHHLKTRLNDIGTKYALASHIPPQTMNCLMLTLLDNMMQTNKTGYFNKFIEDLTRALRSKQVNGRAFETEQDWSRVQTVVYVLIHCISINKFVPPKEVLKLL